MGGLLAVCSIFGLLYLFLSLSLLMTVAMESIGVSPVIDGRSSPPIIEYVPVDHLYVEDAATAAELLRSTIGGGLQQQQVPSQPAPQATPPIYIPAAYARQPTLQTIMESSKSGESGMSLSTSDGTALPRDESGSAFRWSPSHSYALSQAGPHPEVPDFASPHAAFHIPAISYAVRPMHAHTQSPSSPELSSAQRSTTSQASTN